MHSDKCRISQVTITNASTSMCPVLALTATDPIAGELPLELPWQLLITLFSSLPGLRPIAVCACVSRHWRRAAAQAVPKSVTIDARNSKEVLQLLTKSCNLGAVESVVVLHVEEAAAGFPQGALFARMCAEATCLRDVIL